MTSSFGDSPKMRTRNPHNAAVAMAGSITIVVAAASAPMLGAAVDTFVNQQDLVISFMLREVSNLIAAAAATGLLALITRLIRRSLFSLPAIALVATTVVAVFTIVRFGVQDYVSLLDLTERPRWLGVEILWSVLLWPILVSIMALVAQRERRVNAQLVLLDEARRALQDDHEALRGRIFDHLHGTVTSELVVARVRLNDLATEIPDAALAQRVKGVADHLQRLHELEVRRLAHVMVASGLDTSLDEALHQLAASCEGLCDVRVSISPMYSELDQALGDDDRATLRLTLYRIVEECISNALRHGEAEHVDVAVSAVRDGNATRLELAVSSDGKVPEDDVKIGVGLRVIAARISAYNGSLQSNVVDGRFVVRTSMYVAT